MAFNALSGTISAPDLIATGSFSGSYAGDGSKISTVLGITNNTSNQGDRRVLFYNKTGGTYSLTAHSSFTFDSNNVLNISKATITNDVGIGTSNPTYMLDVATTGSSAFRVKGDTNGLDVNCAIENAGTDAEDDTLLSLTTQPDAGDPSLRFAIAGNETWAMGIDNSDNDKFKISNASTLNTDTRLTIQGNNVGIGTTDPIANLDVAGKIAITAESVTPDQPSDGQGYLYTKTDGKLYWRSHDITEVEIGGGGGGTATAQGPTNSIQFHSGSGELSGSSSLTFDGSVLHISGSGSGGEALSVTGSLLPGATNVYDLGSPDKQWKSLYVSSSTIYFGGEALSVKDGSMRFGSGSAAKGMRVGFMHLLNNGIDMAPNRVFGLNAFQMKFGGGIAYKRNVVSWDYQVLKTDFIVSVQSDTLTSSVVLTLPEATVCVNGQSFVIKDEGGNCHTHNIIISASSSDTIDGEANITLESPYAAVNLYTNGSNKFFIY
tara:strand:- start:1403 stop:2872 length:1470 start_codon:yes stop_codon:yes gene_type:complete